MPRKTQYQEEMVELGNTSYQQGSQKQAASDFFPQPAKNKCADYFYMACKCVTCGVFTAAIAAVIVMVFWYYFGRQHDQQPQSQFTLN